jgi:hypothetical protein
MRCLTVVVAVIASSVMAQVSVASSASAQSHAIRPGTRVKLAAPNAFPGERVGQLHELEPDSLRFGAPNGDSTAVAISSISYLQVSRGMGRTVWGTASGLVLAPGGALIGSVLGLGVFGTTGGEIDHGMAWGAGLGAAAGLVVAVGIWKGSRQEEWSYVSLAPYQRGGATIADRSVATPGAIRVQQRMLLRARLRGGLHVEGSFVEQRGDTIVLSRNAGRTEVLVGDVTDLRMSRGKDKRAGAMIGALWGLGLGAASAAIVTSRPNSNNALADPNCADDGVTICPRDSDLLTGLLYVGAATLAGTAIGTSTGRQRWVPATLPGTSESTPRLTIMPGRDRVTIGVRATF